MLIPFTTFTSKGSIKDGALIFDNPAYFRTIFLKYADTPKVRIVVEKERGTRTKRQNSYYWGIVLKYIAEYMGEREEDLHEIFKAKFLKSRRQWRGAEMTILKSTTDLTSDEFGVYIDRCIQEGAELGVVVPMADKEYRVKEQFPEHF
jgi:hypothetical protein